MIGRVAESRKIAERLTGQAGNLPRKCLCRGGGTGRRAGLKHL